MAVVLRQSLAANVAQAGLELRTLPGKLLKCLLGSRHCASTLSFIDTSLAILATVEWYPTPVLMPSDAEQ